MKNKLLWLITASLVLFMSTTTLVSAKSASDGGGNYTEADKEFYLTDAELAFIRPGLVLEIMDVTIPADLMPEVKFKVTDPAGLPLDIDGVFTPGPISALWTLAYIPVGEEAYVAYTTRDATSPITGDTATQASYDNQGTYTNLAPGEYMYKFATVLPADYAMDATTSLGAQMRRNLGEFELGQYVVNELYHWVPSGIVEPYPRDIASTATCNRCHDPLSLHGGWRTEVGVCVLCHNPTQSTDPDTGDHVDMPYMVHKIHYGANLTNGYTIIGYRQSVHDYSHVEYPDQDFDCAVCHTGGTPTDEFPLVANPNPAPVCDGTTTSMTNVSWGDEGVIEIRLREPNGQLFAWSAGAKTQTTGKWVSDGLPFLMVDPADGSELARVTVHNSVLGCADPQPGIFRGEAAMDHTNWMARPTRNSCGSCHDDIDFENGVGHFPQSNDDSCDRCHDPMGEEFDISVTGAHTQVYKSNQLEGFLIQVVDIEDTGPGDNPRVVFTMHDKGGAVTPDQINRLRFNLSGPNDDFTFYVQENVLNGIEQVGDKWAYRFMAALPEDAMGSYSFGVEGRISATLNPGEDNEMSVRDQLQNFIEPMAVTDDMPMTRRAVVDDGKCESCHSNLSLHGSNRHNANGYCQTCHMPGATDAAVRPEGEGAPQSIDFRYMIHKIHRGEDLVNGYTVYGYRSSFHDFSDVVYPGDLRNCEACHVNGSYNLPLPAGNVAVTTPRDVWTPMLPETASCLSCHDTDSAYVHADSNTTDLGEACASCHGEGKTYSVDRLHAR